MSDPLPYVAAAFRGRGRQRSKVYLWMAEHYDELVAAKMPGTRVDWVSVTAEMSAMGFKAAGNRTLKPGTVRRTWYRVEEDRKRGILPPPASNPAATRTPAKAAKSAAGVTEPVQPPDEGEGDFKFKRLKL